MVAVGQATTRDEGGTGWMEPGSTTVTRPLTREAPEGAATSNETLPATSSLTRRRCGCRPEETSTSRAIEASTRSPSITSSRNGHRPTERARSESRTFWLSSAPTASVVGALREAPSHVVSRSVYVRAELDTFVTATSTARGSFV